MTKEIKNPFVVTKNVVLPILSLVVDKTYYIRIDEPLFKGKPMLDEKTGELKEPVDLANVTNHDVETGNQTECQIVMPTVLKGILADTYQNAEYVGKWFAVTKLPKKGTGQRQYHPFNVAEVAYNG